MANNIIADFSLKQRVADALLLQCREAEREAGREVQKALDEGNRKLTLKLMLSHEKRLLRLWGKLRQAQDAATLAAMKQWKKSVRQGKAEKVKSKS